MQIQEQMTLFSDSETFTKVRPRGITAEQKTIFFRGIAKEIINDNYSESKEDVIFNDLLNINLSYSGFDIAKSLESDGAGKYKCNSMFVEFLENLQWEVDEIIKQNHKDWVKAHNIKPKYSKGDKLFVNNTQFKPFVQNEKVFINGIKEETGHYIVHQDPFKNGGYMIEFEIVELNCSLI